MPGALLLDAAADLVDGLGSLLHDVERIEDRDGVLELAEIVRVHTDPQTGRGLYGVSKVHATASQPCAPSQFSSEMPLSTFVRSAILYSQRSTLPPWAAVPPARSWRYAELEVSRCCTGSLREVARFARLGTCLIPPRD